VECRDIVYSCYAECRYSECHYAECHYAECRYAECNYAECHYAECRYAECRGAVILAKGLLYTLSLPAEPLAAEARASIVQRSWPPDS